jgi:hypothetical protein
MTSLGARATGGERVPHPFLLILYLRLYLGQSHLLLLHLVVDIGVIEALQVGLAGLTPSIILVLKLVRP